MMKKKTAGRRRTKSNVKLESNHHSSQCEPELVSEQPPASKVEVIEFIFHGILIKSACLNISENISISPHAHTVINLVSNCALF